MGWNDFDISINDKGELVVGGHKGFVEPKCHVCGEPIQWVLDIMSFVHDKGSYYAGHARCLWTVNGLQTQIKLIKQQEKNNG